MPIVGLEKSQVHGFVNLEFRTQCFVNENQKRIREDFDKLKAKYGSVLGHSNQVHKRVSSSASSVASKKPKKEKAKKEKEKIEVEYNGALLPFCLETVNNGMIAFFKELQKCALSLFSI